MVPVPLPTADLAHIHAHTQPLWAEARGRRFLMTGGTGFFGRWLCESFAYINQHEDLGAELVVLTRDPEGFRTRAPHLAQFPGISLHHGNVRNFDFPDGKFSYVIHAATTAAHCIDPLENCATIVEGTRRTLECALRSGATSFLLTSSGAIYGPQPSDLPAIPETYLGGPDPLASSSTYAESKRLAELLCVLHQDRLAIKVARCFAFHGPLLPLDQHFAMGNLLRDALAGAPLRIRGDGSPLRSYLYAADLAIWLWTILFRAPTGRAYNVGAPEPISIAGLAREIVSSLQFDLPVLVAGTPTGKPPARYVPDVRRATEELGLTSLISRADGIRRSAAFIGQFC